MVTRLVRGRKRTEEYEPSPSLRIGKSSGNYATSVLQGRCVGEMGWWMCPYIPSRISNERTRVKKPSTIEFSVYIILILACTSFYDSWEFRSYIAPVLSRQTGRSPTDIRGMFVVARSSLNRTKVLGQNCIMKENE